MERFDKEQCAVLTTLFGENSRGNDLAAPDIQNQVEIKELPSDRGAQIGNIP